MVEGLVSTIIPVHNRGALLREAVASVVAQSYRPIEVIIIDDGSTDETAGVADELAASRPEEISVIHQANTGPGPAREAGRQLAKGEFVQYLDSDDLLLPTKFDSQVKGLREHPECGVSYGKTRYSANRHEDVSWKRTGEEITTMFPSFLESRWWGTSTPLYRSTVTNAAGPWTELRNEEDWEYDCRIAVQGVRLHYVSAFVSEEREHDGARLSRGGSNDKVKLGYRAAAHTLILKHAHNAGMNERFREMEQFARELFLLSRQCGAVGLAEESKQLFDLARQAAGESRGKGWDFRLYAFLASLVGWTRLGKMACYSDEIRSER